MLRSVAVLALLAGVAHADDKRCLDVQFTPSDNLQIVAWITDANGAYVDTVFITQQTGTFGLGNRPGRFDFNSGPDWPYGRRITTFPVWSHANGQSFASVIFQNDTSEDPNACFPPSTPNYPNCGENNLSHPADQGSVESHYCRPMTPTEAGWDTGTCATAKVGTDKGRFSTSGIMTGYPPRADIVKLTGDSASVTMYKDLNPFDAVSQPTPAAGAPSHAPWLVPSTLPAGNYILYVETSKESDFNTTYSGSTYPSPVGLFWSDYGVPYRGQPSVVYSVPFTISDAVTTAIATDYIGYGDPAGADGMVRPPDATITTDTPSSGASRLELVAAAEGMYRVKVSVTPNATDLMPDAPTELQSTDINSNTLTMSFVAPGEGPAQDRVAGYEVRIRASTEMTEDNFADSMPVTAKVSVDDPGHLESFDLSGLLPETDYWVGVRAYDGCHNIGPVAITKVTTLKVVSGSVDACFVATAAYGSLMANDVEALRSFRDTALETNTLGELAVETYYTFGPALAGVIGQSDLLRASARGALQPIVARIRAAGF
ncbi:MAG: fibronectin type III domain-containing protein [Kofleriaceae bacterium]